ncbi:Transducin/WD40 repeat-like superfamily protein [Rhynchospora pubera]|uniref:Transducin/WD40 repeat-like superfamily protein n=1 Tax=Rhynchospora pubera TaxID=906938 RepID=A0AAV8G4P3_9POAL|nr:Transducin/WD40 repeat-like superfamily protein [Rhynchospora pubera]
MLQQNETCCVVLGFGDCTAQHWLLSLSLVGQCGGRSLGEMERALATEREREDAEVTKKRKMWKSIRHWEGRSLHPSAFSYHLFSSRVASLNLCNCKEFLPLHRGTINSLQLSATFDGSAAVFGMQQPTCHEGPPVSPLIAKLRCLLHLTSGHKFTTSRAFCYPVDTGFFITASFDHYVKLWDTNSTLVLVVMEYKILQRCPGPPSLIRFCIWCFHSYLVLSSRVMSVEWSRFREFTLMMGRCNYAICFWDIRCSGSFLVLDQSLSQLGRRSSLLPRASNMYVSFLPYKITLSLGNSEKNIQSKIQLKAAAQRSYPRMASSQNHATAHCEAVNRLRETADGFYFPTALRAPHVN